MHYDQLKIKAMKCIDSTKEVFVYGFKVLDNRKFIESHIATIDTHRGNMNFSAFYYRLLAVVNDLMSF
jgi:hypothetical protein